MRELAEGGQLTADELARRMQARQWVDLRTALHQLAELSYVSVVGTLGRAEARYRTHPRCLPLYGALHSGFSDASPH
jgi:hypothetical protein